MNHLEECASHGFVTTARSEETRQHATKRQTVSAHVVVLRDANHQGHDAAQRCQLRYVYTTTYCAEPQVFIKTGSFHLLHLMFDDYVLYLVESLQSTERAKDLLRAIKGQAALGQSSISLSYSL
jgi:hypothetical protein